MKKTLSCLLLLMMLFLAGCQAAPTDDAPADNSANIPSASDPASTPFTPPAPYTRQYAYPENMNFRILDTGNVVDSMLDGGSSDRKTEYTLAWEQPLVQPSSIETEKTFTVDGRDVTARYQETEHSLYQLSPSLVYVYALKYSFSVHATKGHLTGFTDHGKMQVLAPVEASSAIAEETAVATASAFVGDIVDVSEYRITCENKETYYYVEFVKCFGDVESIDKAFVYVSMTGEVVHYYAFALGELSSELTLNISPEAADAAVLARVEEMYYENLVEKYHFLEVSVRNKYVILANDGTLALVYDLDVEAKAQSAPNSFEVSSAAPQLVLCENSSAE